MLLILPGSTAKSLKQAEVTTLGVQITSLVLESTGSLPEGGNSHQGKAEGKMTFSLGRVLASFLFKVSPTCLYSGIPHVYPHHLLLPWLCLLSPHSPEVGVTFPFRCPLCHSCTSAFNAPQSPLTSDQAT